MKNVKTSYEHQMRFKDAVGLTATQILAMK